ncbi:2'-5' RNA ligase family protein [Curtobacterium sp. SP.BCo]|uniref:2'-5' RNA ligase family protein n=1 Tax=Curtobacterium sp. SP.BCo TaxID=3435229 RepID=UPI003F73FA73
MRSIELVLEPSSDAAVRTAWAALVDAGLPSLGRHPSPSNAPHVTLAAGPTLPVPSTLGVPVPETLLLGGVLLFPAGPGRSVLVRAVVLDPALAALHEAVHRVAPGAVDTSLPGRWSPHVSFARRVRDEDLPRAVAALRDVPLPPTLEVAGVRHWDGGTRTVTAVG